MLLRGKLTPRRRILLAAIVLLLALLGLASWQGMAITRGVETRDMDWNADGTVSRGEILQAFYAVTATRERTGERECTTFTWYRSGESIRVDCQTVFDDGKGAAAE